jgi:hypothetical protein
MSNVNGYLMRTNRARQRRRRFIIIATVVGLLVLLAVGVLWLLVSSPLFLVRTVMVTGSGHVPPETVRSVAAGVVVQNSLFRRTLGAGNLLAWTSGSADEILCLLPALKQITIERRYGAHEVVLATEERQPAGIWCLHTTQMNADSNDTRINADNKQINADGTVATDSIQINADGAGAGGTSTTATASGSDIYQRGSALYLRESASRCFWFDGDGIIFERAPNAEGSVIRVVHDYAQQGIGLGSAILPSRFIGNLFSVLRVLDASGLGIREVRIDDLALEEVNVATYGGPPARLAAASAKQAGQAGPALYFSLRFPADNAFAVLQSFAGGSSSSAAVDLKRLEYIDFRTENRAYYK